MSFKTTFFGRGAALGISFFTTGGDGFSQKASFKTGSFTLVSAIYFGGSSCLKKTSFDSQAHRKHIKNTQTRLNLKIIDLILTPLIYFLKHNKSRFYCQCQYLLIYKH